MLFVWFTTWKDHFYSVVEDKDVCHMVEVRQDSQWVLKTPGPAPPPGRNTHTHTRWVQMFFRRDRRLYGTPISPSLANPSVCEAAAGSSSWAAHPWLALLLAWWRPHHLAFSLLSLRVLTCARNNLPLTCNRWPSSPLQTHFRTGCAESLVKKCAFLNLF